MVVLPQLQARRHCAGTAKGVFTRVGPGIRYGNAVSAFFETRKAISEAQLILQVISEAVGLSVF